MMLRPILLGLCLSAILTARCSADDVKQAVNGTPIGRDEFLWFAAIVEGITPDDFICSGVLISPRHVVTADHCLDHKHVTDVWVRVGYFCPQTDNCLRPFKDENVVEHRRNPSLGDIAILVLAFPVAPTIFAPAIPDVGLPSYLSRINKGDDMLLVGAGKDGDEKQLAQQAETLTIQLRHTNYKRCRKAIKNKQTKNLVSKSTICSLSSEGKPCQGDSGSAILLDSASEGRGDVVVAIHTYGPRFCTTADNDTLFGHVAISAVADFVISVVCGGDEWEGSWCPPPTQCSRTSPAPAPQTCSAECCGACGKSSSCPPAPDSPPPTVTKSATLFEPTLSPTREPTLSPTREPTLSPTPKPTFSPTPKPTLSPTPKPTLSPTPKPTFSPTLGPTVYRVSLQGRLVHTLYHRESVNTMAFDAPSSRLASADYGNIVHVWDSNTWGFPQLTFRLDECCPHAMEFDPAGTTLAVAEGFNVALLDLTGTSSPRKLRGHTDNVWGVGWSPNGEMLASGGEDNTVKLWTVAERSVRRNYRGHTDWIESLAFDPQGRYIASCSSDTTIRLWDASSSNTPARVLRGHLYQVWHVQFSPDGTRLASASADETVRVWSVVDGLQIGAFGVRSNVVFVAWSDDGRFVASCSDDRVLRVWDATTYRNEALLELEGHTDRIFSAVWGPNARWIASGSLDTTVKIWEITIN